MNTADRDARCEREESIRLSLWQTSGTSVADGQLYGLLRIVEELEALRAEREPVATVQRLRLEPGDTLVVRLGAPVDEVSRQHIAAAWTEKLPAGVTVMVTFNTAGLDVLCPHIPMLAGEVA